MHSVSANPQLICWTAIASGSPGPRRETSVHQSPRARSHLGRALRLGHRRENLHHLAVFFCAKPVSLAAKRLKRIKRSKRSQDSKRSGGTIVKPTTTLLLMSGLALTGLFTGAAPSAAQSPAPPIVVQGAPAADEAAAPAAQAPPPAAQAPAPAAKKKNAEVLPWADKPLTPMAEAPAADLAAAEAAAAQCSGLFEAACRDLKTCAWVADVALEDGTLVPARCAARPPAPPKKAAKKKAPPKKTVAAPEETASTTPAPAVKAAVTRIEDEEPAAAPKAEAPQVQQTKAAVTTEPPQAPEAAPVVEKKEQAESTEAEQKSEPAKDGPVVVKPPSEPAAPTAPQTPSFGSISGFGGGNAIVVTVPPASE